MVPNPVVDISVGSRFHAFDLARELDTQGMLRTLHTGYPALAATRFGLRSTSVRSVWTHEPLNRAAGWLHRKGIIRSRYDNDLATRFDRVVAQRLRPGANVFVGWANQCRKSLAAASRLGMVTVVERGSTHIRWQQSILAEEATLSGLPTEVPDPRTVERELCEYEQADFVMVPSRFAAETFANQGHSRSRVVINPYGVDLRRFVNESVEIDTGPLKVIQVGRVSVRKGVHYLAPAVARVPGATVSFVGIVDAGMERVVGAPHTRIVGPVPGHELPAWYRRHNVACLVSVEEGFGLVLTQAMAMGLPVITTRNAGGAEIVQEGVNGFIVPMRDPDAIAEKLQVLADDPMRRAEMGRQARLTVADGYTWSDYGERAARAYRAMLGGGAA
jgi:glycosyltransferase involved in cell wall biosynthesis